MDKYTVYFAGGLFTYNDIIGNKILARTIEEQSQGQYIINLPQDFELRTENAKYIRDRDFTTLLNSYLAIFNYDGTELDSGTVIEYMAAKFSDIPSLIIRTDLRNAGDNKDVPWNLMSSHFPRTETIITKSLIDYKSQNLSENSLTETLAKTIIEKLNILKESKPLKTNISKKDLLNWISQSFKLD